MPHLLAKLKNVPLLSIKEVLENDKEFHASKGMFLKQLWQNADNENEVVFLFEVNDLQQTKQLITQLHSETLAQNPDANLPDMTYLQ
ncbi:hypothetical protein [Flavobacterium agrisoli]|uniref:Uncharacterized protein n=1 Tax=Flavobacterium agrisoli TaxID=2793066 RepID=A0A934PLV5_9FLAO|nr:hypothetical protein [Flavobacterium agrisoli]MBK0369200.1 hypothetical protein [Flavobacterium agrisoli]